MVIRIPFSAILALALLLGVWGGAFGIAWGVVEWQAGGKGDVDRLWHALDEISPKLQTVEGDLQMLEGDLGRLENRVSKVETPAPIADRDIQELYARTDYTACCRDATTRLADAEKLVHESFADYVTGHKTYAEYGLDYDVYKAAYVNYTAELDACWATYSQASPYELW